MLKLVVYHDRIDGIGHDQELKIVEGLKKVAKIIKVDTTKGFKEIEEEYFKTRTSDLYNKFASNASLDIMGSRIEKQLQELKSYEDDIFPSEKEIQDVLNIYENKLSKETRERLKDYLYFKESQEFRKRKN